MTNKAGKHKAIFSAQTCWPKNPWQLQEWNLYSRVINLTLTVNLITLPFIYCPAKQLENTGYKKHPVVNKAF